MSKAVANLTQLNETITFSAQDNGETINVKINELARGPAGADGPNSVTSATTSDGTANLSLSNVTTATATVTGTLTADHIHGNLAGSVYAHVRAGETLAKGDPVYVSGSHGTGANLIAIVSKADASDPLKMPAVGVMDAAVTANANGHMVITGTISDINTATYSVNAELYVAEGGGFTATPPNAYAQPVARVERSNTNNGAVIVKVNGLSAISPTASTLVRRDSSGVSDFNTINIGDLHTGGSPVGPGGSIGKYVLTGSSGVGISGTPDVALEAATHRLTLASSGIAITSGTITTSQPLSLTQTWNAAGVTFKGIDVNVTDTASASGSLLMDLRVGGVSKFSVSKSGVPTIPSGFYNNPSIRNNAVTPSGMYFGVSTIGFGRSINGYEEVFWDLSSGRFAFSNISLWSEAANTLAQRNGTNAQAFRIYNTFTDASNYERGFFRWSSNVLEIGTESAGNGSSRDINLTVASGKFINAQTAGSSNYARINASTICTATTGSNWGVLVNTFANGRIDLAGAGSFIWGTGTSIAGTGGGLGIRKESDGVCEINNGTAGTLRDLKLRNIVASGDVEVTDSTKGIILKSPDGTRYRVQVANGGTLTVTAV